MEKTVARESGNSILAKMHTVNVIGTQGGVAVHSEPGCRFLGVMNTRQKMWVVYASQWSILNGARHRSKHDGGI